MVITSACDGIGGSGYILCVNIVCCDQKTQVTLTKPTRDERKEPK